jgi:hypothetical protein
MLLSGRELEFTGKLILTFEFMTNGYKFLVIES